MVVVTLVMGFLVLCSSTGIVNTFVLFPSVAVVAGVVMVVIIIMRIGFPDRLIVIEVWDGRCCGNPEEDEHDKRRGKTHDKRSWRS